MGAAVTPPFRLPQSKTIDHVRVRLSDGTIVTRTAEQLVKRPTSPAAK